MRIERQAAASIAVALSGLLWGLFWIPLRELQGAGVNSGLATILLYAAAAIVVLPAAIRRRSELRGAWGAVFLTGVFTGGGFALYTLALMMTEVARTILLFYLTPAWGALLGWFLLRERPTRLGLLGLASAFLGLMIVFRADEQLPWPRNAGDVLALTAGIMWAYGSLRLYAAGTAQSVATSVFAFFVGGSAVAAVAVAALGGLGWSATGAAGFPYAMFLFTLCVFVVPGVVLTLGGAAHLTAMRVGILLMGEVVVGVGSAALLAGEPFGLREALGTVLVIAAGLMEVLGRGAGPAAKGRG